MESLRLLDFLLNFLLDSLATGLFEEAESTCVFGVIGFEAEKDSSSNCKTLTSTFPAGGSEITVGVGKQDQ